MILFLFCVIANYLNMCFVTSKYRFLSYGVFVLLILLFACEKLEFDKKPEVHTLEVEEAGLTNGVVKGRIEDIRDVTEYGFCWSKDRPGLYESGVDQNQQKLDPAGLDYTFTATIEGLEPDEHYYVWAFASNTTGTTYGDTVSFRTKYKPPIVLTAEVTDLTANSASCGGDALADGGEEITQKGVCFSTNEDPTLEDSFTNDGFGIGSFESQLTNLTVNTGYYVRAYVTNTNGTFYGSQMSFTTQDGLPVVITGEIRAIAATSAEGGGEVSDDGGYAVNDRGLCLSTEPNPTINDDCIQSGSGTGVFNCSMEFLTEWTNYYVRAYASNENGTAYGECLSFTANSPLEDIDGNHYQTVKIGAQVWMKENLRTTRYADGTEMVDGSAEGDISGEYTTPYYFSWNDDSNYAESYGFLYTWSAAMNQEESNNTNPGAVQGACPDGWHLPSDEDWKELEDALGMAAGDLDITGWRGSDEGLQLKATDLWGNGGMGNNDSQFTAIPAGQRKSNGDYSGLGFHAIFWTSTEYYNSSAWFRKLTYSHSGIYRSFDFKSEAASIRCVRDL